MSTYKKQKPILGCAAVLAASVVFTGCISSMLWLAYPAHAADTTANADKVFVEEIAELRAEAAHGDVKAQNAMGLVYHIGAVVYKDDAEAVRWYSRAAEQGDISAQVTLGNAFSEHGDPRWKIQKNEAESLKWYHKAAEQGDAMAQFEVGYAAEDKAESISWFRKAAERGNAPAQLNLGYAYQYGQSVPQDNIQAYMWYSLAVSNGLGQQSLKNAFKQQARLEKAMTHEQIAEAQRRAEEWMQQHSNAH